jgi:hypothetical protein
MLQNSKLQPVLFRLGLAALALVASAALAAAEPAATRDGVAGGTLAGFDRLLAKIKAEHPDATILKAEMRTRDLEGRQPVYVVKLLPADGRITRLTVDAHSLEVLEHAGGDPQGRGQHRRRERHRGNRL